jgi:tellurite resistance protein TerC
MIHSTLGIAIGSPELWAISIAAVIALFGLDFLITRKPHEVSMKEAIGWSAFYIALPLAFGVWIWQAFGSQRGLEFYAGYLVEKSLSVDNLFVFMLLLGSFAVPRELQQRVLLIGVAGALVLRGVFIALGAAMLANFAWTFLLFGIILLATAVKVLRDTLDPAEHEIHPNDLRIVKLARRFFPVSDGYRGPRMSVREDGRRVITPLALATLAILATDVLFAVDSVPAVYGITGDAYLVFVTNAFALLGLRALYFVLEGALGALVHLGYGLAAILAFIGGKLVMHWAHGVWSWVPEIDTLLSLGVIVGILAIVITTSLISNKRTAAVSD